MSHVQKSQVVNAPIAPTWAAVSRLGAVEEWHPNVARATVLTAHDSGIGASRQVEFQDGNSAVETVIEESELHFTKMEMSASSPLSEIVVTIRTEERSADTTEVTFSVDYGMKYGPIGWMIDVGMMRRVFDKVFTAALGGLSYHLETGDLVTDVIPQRAAA